MPFILVPTPDSRHQTPIYYYSAVHALYWLLKIMTNLPKLLTLLMLCSCGLLDTEDRQVMLRYSADDTLMQCLYDLLV